MAFDTVSFRIDRKRKAQLDAIAEATDRDRSYVLNLAVADYIESQQWQIDRIEEGLAAVRDGDFASDAGVAAARAKWRKPGK